MATALGQSADAAAYSSSESDDSGADGHPNLSTDQRAGEFGDFNPRKRRRTGRDAKESAALGIFGSDSEDEGPGIGRLPRDFYRYNWPEAPPTTMILDETVLGFLPPLNEAYDLCKIYLDRGSWL